LHETLGMFEVVLRNALDRQLTAYHLIVLRGDGHWYADPRMPWTSKKLVDQIDRARAQATANGKNPEIHPEHRCPAQGITARLRMDRPRRRSVDRTDQPDPRRSGNPA
jgi:hypothetical protein